MPALKLHSLASSDPFPFRIEPSSFATVAFEIEREDAVETCGASEDLGMAQRADGIVVTRAPVILHRQPGKFVILGVTFVVPSPVDQLDDVVSLVAGDRLQDVQIIATLDICRQPAQQRSKGTLDAVHILELGGARSRAA